MRVSCRQENPFQRKSWQVKVSSLVANKALKAVAAPLDVSNRRMLRILRAACSRPLALRWADS